MIATKSSAEQFNSTNYLNILLIAQNKNLWMSFEIDFDGNDPGKECIICTFRDQYNSTPYTQNDDSNILLIGCKYIM